MWKIQNEKNTTKFEKQTLRFEIKKEKISILRKLPTYQTKNNIFEFTSSNNSTSNSPGIVHVSVKRIGNEKDQAETLYQRHCFYVCPLPQLLLLLEDYVLYSFQPPQPDRFPPLHFDTMVSGSRDGSRGPRVSEMLD